MDLNYIIGHDKKKLKRFDEHGYDLESLFIISKDFFSICEDLQLSNIEASEFFIRLKIMKEASEGQPFPPNLFMYENSKTCPSRISIVNNDTYNKVLFKIVPGQGKCEKQNVLFRCEMCREDAQIKRSDLKIHN